MDNNYVNLDKEGNMKTHQAYLSISEIADFQTFLGFIKSLELKIKVVDPTSFSPKEAASADIIFVDENTAGDQCVLLSDIKKESSYFLPVLLLSSGKPNNEQKLPGCVDDVIFKDFSPSVWKKRLETYLQLREKEEAILRGKSNEFSALFTNSHAVMLLLDANTGKIEEANRAACQFYGYSHDELTRMNIRQINKLADEKIAQKINSAYENKRNHFVFKHKLADGSIRDVDVFSEKVNHDGKEMLYSVIHDITEKVMAAQLLKESEENYHQVIENAPDIVVIIDKSGTIRYVNQRIREYGNYDPDNIIGRPVSDFIPPEDVQEAGKAVNRVYNKKQTGSQFSTWLLLDDGSRVPVLTRGTLIKYHGEILNMTVIRDISFMKAAEKKLEESKETLENIFNNNSVAIYVQDKEGVFLDINKAALQQYGLPDKKVLIGKTPEFVAAESKNDMAEIKKYIRLAFEGKPQQFEFWAKHSQGTVFPKMVLVEKGTYFGQPAVYNFSFDLSERKKMEEALRESENKYRSLAETSSDLILTFDINGQLTYLSPAVKKITGYTGEEALSKNFWEFLAPEDVEPTIEKFKRGIAGEHIPLYEINLVHKSGRRVPVELNVTSLMDADDKPVGRIVVARDITDRKNAENALRQSEARLKIFSQITREGIVIHDQGVTRDANRTLLDMLGYSLDEIVGKNIIELVVAPEYRALTYEKLKNPATRPYDIQAVKKDGTYVPVEISGFDFVNKSGKKMRAVVARDISLRREMEQALRDSENKYRSLAETSIDMIATYDLEGTITYVNRAAENIFGYTPEEVIGRKFGSFVSPGCMESAMAYFNSGIHGEHVPPYELEIVHKSGRIIPVEINPTSLHNAEGKITGRLTIIRDVTFRKKAEQALRESEKKYREQSRLFRLMSDNIPDLVWAKDMEGRFIFVNKADCDRLLIAKDIKEPIGKTDMFFANRQRKLHPDKKDWFTFGEICINSDEVIIKSKKAQRFEEYGYVQGKFLFLDVYKAPIIDENGEMIGTVGHGRDVTKEKESEKELLLRDKALNTAANAIIFTDIKGKIKWINKAFTKLSGYSMEESIGKNTADLIDSGKQDKAFFENLNSTLAAGKVWKGEITDKRKDGTLYEVEEVVTPVTDRNGKVEHLIGIMTDISERKAAERELRAAKEAAEESNRLKSAFLANMNHEIRTPMNAIMGFSELLLEASPEEMENYAKIVNNSAEQLLNLIDDVIFLSRLQSEKLPVKEAAFSPAELIKEDFQMFNLPGMKKNLDIRIQLPENADNLLVEADAYKIRQVLTNLTANAIKYTDKGFVKLGFEHHDKEILFYVEDSGMGIPEEEHQHIFEAFYRGDMAVKSAIRGTGLGLNIAKGLVELMGGAIGLTSRPGKGSRFSFSIPCKPVTSIIPQTTPVQELKKWKELAILVAEDDETNYLYLKVLLKDKVNRLDRAQNGQEAVEMTRQENYDLVLMDIKMPVMSGDEATRKIKKLYPDLPVIATTAYATQEEKERALAAGCDDYLSKPIKKADLMSRIDKYVSGKD